MATKKFSELTTLDIVNANLELTVIPVLDTSSGTTRKVTLQQINDSIEANIPFAAAAFTQANTPSQVANSASSYANAAFLKANTATTDAANADSKAVSSGVYANAAFAVANSGITDSWARDTANAASSYANSSYSQANTANTLAQAAFNAANNVNVSGNTGNVTFSNQVVIGTGDQTGGSGLYLAPGTDSAANSQYLRVRGGDYPTHIHLDTGNNSYYDQYFGDDGKYVLLSNTGNIMINTNDYAGNTAQWTFDRDGTLTLPNGSSIESTAGNGIGLTTDRGTILFGNSPEIGAPSHFHIMKPESTTGVDLYFGDDHNFVLQRGTAYGDDPAYGVEIGANDRNEGGQKRWRFGTDGNLIFPAGSKISNYPGYPGGDSWFVTPPINAGGVASADGQQYVQVNNGYGVEIGTGWPAAAHAWHFGLDGSLTFPDSSIQNTSYTGLSKFSTVTTSTHTFNELTEDILFCDPNSAGSQISIYLPDSIANGKSFTVKNINAGGNVVYVQVQTGNTPLEIETGSVGTFNYANIANTGSSITWLFDGTTYRIINEVIR